MTKTYRIGQIVPSSNTTMETEVPAMLPKTVSALAGWQGQGLPDEQLCFDAFEFAGIARVYHEHRARGYALTHDAALLADLRCLAGATDGAQVEAAAARLLGLDASACFAAGDNFNDLSMLDPRHARMIACPVNALDPVKGLAQNLGGARELEQIPRVEIVKSVLKNPRLNQKNPGPPEQPIPFRLP